MVRVFGYNMSITFPLMYSFVSFIGRSILLFICILFIYNQSHYVCSLMYRCYSFVKYALLLNAVRWSNVGSSHEMNGTYRTLSTQSGGPLLIWHFNGVYI
jgi:hypothetical protein